MPAVLDLTGTRTFAGVALQRLLLGPCSYVLYAFIASPLVYLSYLKSPSPLLLFAFELGFLLFAVRAFVRQEFASEGATPTSSLPPLELLSFDVVLKLRHPTAVTVPLLVDAALRTPCVSFILKEVGLDPKEGRRRILDLLGDGGDVSPFLEEAASALEDLRRSRISPSVILRTAFRNSPKLQELLNSFDLSLEDLDQILRWEWFHHHIYGEKVPALSPRGLLRSLGGMGRKWVMGYTDALDRLTLDLSEGIEHRFQRNILIHEAEIQAILHVLSRSTQHNVIVVGKAGVGKRTLIENLTYRLRILEREQGLPYTRVLLLRTEELLSGTIRPDTFLLEALRRAERSGRFVLVVPDLGQLLRSSDEQVKGVFLRFLQAETINVVAISDAKDYHTHVKVNPAFEHAFEEILLQDSDDDETLAILMEEYFRLEGREKVSVSYKAMKELLSLTKRYIGSHGLPGAAVSVLEDSMLLAFHGGGKVVTEDEVRKVISLKSHVDVSEVSTDEKAKLLSLEKVLKEKIIGQDEAVAALVNTLKRARLDIGAGKRPYGTFLFLGPTGVGKTHTAKVIAKEFFGSEENFVRLDMNEYSTEDSVAGITGSPRGGEGYLARRIQDRPFSLVLLDEIEKAHPKVLNLFLQILDEGFFMDSTGMKTDFRNTIIAATSNAGALFIRDYVLAHPQWEQGEGRNEFRTSLIDTILQSKAFSPEFLNRFDEVIVYQPLRMRDAEQIALLMVMEIIRAFQEERGITVRLEDDALREIVRRGYSLEFGAREMRRAVTDTVENFLAEYLLTHNVRRGEEITIRLSDLPSPAGRG